MDYISREFIKQLGGECISARNNDGELVPILSIDLLPAADVRENKHGKNLSPDSLFECSVCGASCSDTLFWDCKINFCPNCGADMR